MSHSGGGGGGGGGDHDSDGGVGVSNDDALAMCQGTVLLLYYLQSLVPASLHWECTSQVTRHAFHDTRHHTSPGTYTDHGFIKLSDWAVSAGQGPSTKKYCDYWLL